MTTVTLRPNAIDSDDGVWQNSGGAGSKNAATSDNSDSTFLSHNPGSFSGDGSDQYVGNIWFGVGTTVIPALAQIKNVTPRMRMQNTAITGTKGFLWGLGVAAMSAMAEYYTTTGAGFSTITGTPRTTLNGTPWTQAMIDNLQIFVQAYYNFFGSNAPSWQVAEMYLDVLYNEAPVATVTAPTEGGSVTTTTRPTITWTYSDPEADTQERYRVKIFSAAQYGIGGFSPETSPSTWDSGEVFSSATSVVPPFDLTNSTTYRAYVKVADTGSGGRYGNWDNNTFSIAITAPPAPFFTVTAQPSSALGPRTKLVIVRTSDATPTTYMVIEYTDDPINLLSDNDASVEGGVGNWAANVNSAVTQQAVFAQHGSNSLRIRSLAAGTMSARTATGLSGYAVTAGLTYTLRADIIAASALALRTVRVKIDWYNGAAFLSTSTGDSVEEKSGGAGGAPVTAFVTAVAPANATRATMIIEVLSTTSISEDHHADKIQFAQGYGTKWSLAGQATFLTLRGASAISNLTDGTVYVFYDYEATPKVPRSYRAKAVRTI